MVKVQTIDGGEFAANALMYKPPSQQVMEYLNNGLDKIMNYTSGLSDRFKETVQGIYNKAFDNRAIEASKYLLAQSDYALQEDMIYTVPYDGFSNINMTMQQYIMAEPTLNNLYKKNMCHGFQETYFDYEPETYGKERYDYQRVMDGVLQFDKDEEGLAYIESYSNTDEVEITIPEQLAILTTWENVVRIIEEGNDPSEQN